MTFPLVLIVLVSTNELQSPATVALRRAAHDFLGANSEVRIERYQSPPADAELSSNQQGADAVAQVSWADERRRRAFVRCYLERSHRFVSRYIVFDARDEMVERGKTLGFAIAAMLPKPVSPPGTAAVPGTAGTPGSAASGAPAAPASSTPAAQGNGATPNEAVTETSDAAPAKAASEPAPEANARASTEPEENRTDSSPLPPKPTASSPVADELVMNRPIRPAASAPLGHGAIDVSALAASGVTGSGGGIGAGIAARWFFRPPIALRLAGGIRYGRVAEADASSTVFLGGLGLAFQFTRPDSFVALGGRVDALLTAFTLTRSRSNDAVSETQTRIQPSADLLLEGGFYLWESGALLLAAGGEFGLGHSDVVVQNKEVADIAAFRLVAEMGARVRF